MFYNLKNVSLVIATFNEEESIEYVLNELENYNFFEIIVVDNNSTDLTLEIVKKYNTKILVQNQPGWGYAVKQGFEYASGEFITYMDADGSYNPNSIVEMYELTNQYNFICGSRYKFNNHSEDDTLIRALGNSIFTFICNKLLNLNLSDSLFFYPMIRKNDYKLISPKSNNFGLCIEIPYLLAKNNLAYTDILSLERKRYAGKTKVNTFRDGFKILIEIFRMRFLNI